MGRRRPILAYLLEVTVQDQMAPSVWYMVKVSCDGVDAGESQGDPGTHRKHTQVKESTLL